MGAGLRAGRCAALVVGLAALAVSPASADTPQSTTGTTYFIRDYAEIGSGAPTQPWWSLTFDLVIKLGIVIGLIYLTMWALRTYVLGPQARRRVAAGNSGAISVLDTTMLAPNRALYLVAVADRVLVVGATSTSLSALSEITDPAAVDMLKKKPVEADDVPNFSDQLRALGANLPVAGQSSFLTDKIGELRLLASHFRRPTAEEQ